MMKRLFVPLIFIFSLSNFAQKNKMTLNKDQLIIQANTILATKYPNFRFNASLYEISAWKNSQKTVVYYKRIIKFIPLGKKEQDLTYDFEVNLTSKSVAPFDFFGVEKLYHPNTEDQKKIDFVVKAFNLPHSGFDTKIVEGPNIFAIYLDNEVAFGQYYIDKTTGKECLESIEGSYAPIPDDIKLLDKDPLIEIKE